MTDAVEIKRRRPWAIIVFVGILGLIGALFGAASAGSKIISDEYFYEPSAYWFGVLSIILGYLGIASAIGLIKFKKWGPGVAMVYLLGFIIANIHAMMRSGFLPLSASIIFGHFLLIGLSIAGIYSMWTRRLSIQASQTSATVGWSAVTAIAAPAVLILLLALTPHAAALIAELGENPERFSGTLATPLTRENARLTVAEQRQLRPGDAFKECAQCPEMVVVPNGSFRMGTRGPNWEGPMHEVTIPAQFAIGRFEVTAEEWAQCVADHRCDSKPASFGRAPVVSVSWDEIQYKYLPWLREKTGGDYRLPSEAEWEYAARGTTKADVKYFRYSWGSFVGSNHANCNGCGSQWDNVGVAPVGSFRPNLFGLHDMHGNVWEWVKDCSHWNYKDKPSALNATGAAWESTSCTKRVIRGGSWRTEPRYYLRATHRNQLLSSVRSDAVGFRVVRTVNLP